MRRKIDSADSWPAAWVGGAIHSLPDLDRPRLRLPWSPITNPEPLPPARACSAGTAAPGEPVGVADEFGPISNCNSSGPDWRLRKTSVHVSKDLRTPRSSAIQRPSERTTKRPATIFAKKRRRAAHRNAEHQGRPWTPQDRFHQPPHRLAPERRAIGGTATAWTGSG